MGLKCQIECCQRLKVLKQKYSHEQPGGARASQLKSTDEFEFVMESLLPPELLPEICQFCSISKISSECGR